jgi:hypothetical protein
MRERGKDILKAFLLMLTITGVLSGTCFSSQADSKTKIPGTVNINWNGIFTKVIMDFNDSTHKEMWALYIEKLLQVFPTLEADYDGWLANGMDRVTYNNRLEKLQYLKPQVPKEYQDEIEGMASRFSGGTTNIQGDGKLSIDELYYVSLYIDIIMTGGCSAISVFGPASVTGRNMIARLVDWYPRTDNAVFTIRNGDKSIVIIGRHLSIMAGTAFNEDGVFAALMAGGSPPAVDFESKPYGSVAVDIRYALENYSTFEGVAKYLSDREYTFSHQIFLADSRTGKVLENNLIDGGIRGLRGVDSPLGKGIDWEFDNALAAVNTFFLEENYRGHWVDPRWTNLRRQIATKLRNSQEGEVDKVTLNELKEIATFYNRSEHDAYPGSSIGDIYNSSTQHIVLFEPDTFHVEVFFRNESPSPIKKPTFITVPISFHLSRDYIKPQKRYGP